MAAHRKLDQRRDDLCGPGFSQRWIIDCTGLGYDPTRVILDSGMSYDKFSETEMAKTPGMHISRLRPPPRERPSTGKLSESEERFLREQSEAVERIIKRLEESRRERAAIKERARSKNERRKIRNQKRAELRAQREAEQKRKLTLEKRLKRERRRKMKGKKRFKTTGRPRGMFGNLWEAIRENGLMGRTIYEGGAIETNRRRH
jgi:hypothetical protein